VPYITQDRRIQLEDLESAGDLSAGDLTYLFFKAAKEYDQTWTLVGHLDRLSARYLLDEPRFSKYCTVLGALDSTNRELKRRFPQETIFSRKVLTQYAEDFFYEVMVPYEQARLSENGDV
jgi:hypothetical protein